MNLIIELFNYIQCCKIRLRYKLMFIFRITHNYQLHHVRYGAEGEDTGRNIEQHFPSLATCEGFGYTRLEYRPSARGGKELRASIHSTSLGAY